MAYTENKAGVSKREQSEAIPHEKREIVSGDIPQQNRTQST